MTDIQRECERSIEIAAELWELRLQLLSDPKVRIGKRVIADAGAELRHHMAKWQRELKR